jgi:hypothetical protein
VKWSPLVAIPFSGSSREAEYPRSVRRRRILDDHEVEIVYDVKLAFQNTGTCCRAPAVRHAAKPEDVSTQGRRLRSSPTRESRAHGEGRQELSGDSSVAG